MFYIGGTKCGAIMGEALVILNPALKEGFRYIVKQHGGLLAKGRFLGLQFDTLFEDNLYFKICKRRSIRRSRSAVPLSKRALRWTVTR